MSYKKRILRNPECRDLVVETFFALFDPDYTYASIKSAFEGMVLAAWPDPKSPFFHADKVGNRLGGPEKRAFMVFSALGFSVGCLDSLTDTLCELPKIPPAKVQVVPSEISDRSKLWADGGPITVNNCLGYLDPLSDSGKDFVLSRDFFFGYAAGAGFTARTVGN